MQSPRVVKGSSLAVAAGACLSEGPRAPGTIPIDAAMGSKAKNMGSPSPLSPLRQAGNSLLGGAASKAIAGNSPSSSSNVGTASTSATPRSAATDVPSMALPKDFTSVGNATTSPLSPTSQTTVASLLNMPPPAGGFAAAPSSARPGPRPRNDEASASGGCNAEQGASEKRGSRGSLASAGAVSGNPDRSSGARLAPTEAPGDFSEEEVLKFHSAVRWGKPWSEVEAAISDQKALAAACVAKDPKNGNFALHIACQNGHLQLVEKLVEAGAPLNAQNNKGQTGLHMSVQYDFYFVSKFLVAAGADKDIENGEGHKAITGIDGDKTGTDAWDNAVTILKAATAPDQLEHAFEAISQAPVDSVDKAMLIQAGMQKKSNPATKDIWDHKRFMALAVKF